jgi:hypothetical protein
MTAYKNQTWLKGQTMIHKKAFLTVSTLAMLMVLSLTGADSEKR